MEISSTCKRFVTCCVASMFVLVCLSLTNTEVLRESTVMNRWIRVHKQSENMEINDADAAIYNDTKEGRHNQAIQNASGKYKAVTNRKSLSATGQPVENGKTRENTNNTDQTMLPHSYKHQIRNSTKLANHKIYKVSTQNKNIKRGNCTVTLSPKHTTDHIKVPDVNCQKLFEGQEDEMRKTQKYMEMHQKKVKSIHDYEKMLENCQKFKNDRQYILSPLTKEEEEFPIAYSILVYKDIEMIERLFRAIYRPQNFYCFHVDRTSSWDFHVIIHSLVSCFPNAFVASRLVDVQWGTYTVLEADLICMEDLLKKKKWKYFINLTGQEFPLKTNLELVKILTTYDGANDVRGWRNP